MKNGIVTEIDIAGCRARVQFPDRDGVVSYMLPVMQRNSLKNRHYSMPDIGEHVVCHLDEHGEAGVILGAIYSEADGAPIASAEKLHVTFPDGTFMEYDRSTHVLTADVKGDIVINATGNATITVQGHTDLTSLQGVDIDGGPGGLKGTVQGDCICPLIRRPHLHVSATVRETL